MQFELTHSVNVPAEREKLRRLRNEIAADVAHREAIQRKYSPRGFPLLSDMRELEAEGKQANGSTEVCNVQSWTKVGIRPANALVREPQAGSGGRCESAGGMECEGVKQ
jgi:hypothetical protein